MYREVYCQDCKWSLHKEMGPVIRPGDLEKHDEKAKQHAKAFGHKVRCEVGVFICFSGRQST